MFTNNLFCKIRNSFQDRRNLIAAGLLGLVLVLGAFLRFYQLGAGGVGNTYYAATVKSMLTSWHNFFFAAFEPGGSVSVDKPPLGFWVQALSAYFLGINGFALALPNALADVLSIFVLYKLVRRPFGMWAGLTAALVLAIMPVAISTERNNIIDGLLVFVLLLAAWAFMQSVHTGKLRWLLVGAFIVGVGFNIKMLQATMPLPAFYAVYFFGSKRKWGRKLLDLIVASALLLVVSFSWAVAVDLVPAAERPYVDSTRQNTVMELIFGHNGIERLTNLRKNIGLGDGGDGLFGPDGINTGPQNQADGRNFPQVAPNGGNPPQIDPKRGNLPLPPAGQAFPQAPGNGNGGIGPQGNAGAAGGPGGSMDFGSAGTLRLFTQPLVGEASWLLPFILGGLGLLILALWKRPLDEKIVSVILWAGWLLPEAVYFTFSTGLMHAYYLIILGAPIAALAGMTTWAAWQVIHKHALIGWSVLFVLVAGTLTFQSISLWGTTSLADWAIDAALVLFGLGLCFLALSLLKNHFGLVAVSLFLAAMLVAPAVWSGLTCFNTSADMGLPAAGPARQASLAGGPASGEGNRANQALPQSNANPNGVDQNLLDYLLANTQPGTYLMATDRANDAAAYILATGRPVLTFGGFLGQYNEVSVDQLAALVQSGQLRFVLSQALQGHQEIAEWVQSNCIQVDLNRSGATGQNRQSQNQALYDCGG